MDRKHPIWDGGPPLECEDRIEASSGDLRARLYDALYRSYLGEYGVGFSFCLVESSYGGAADKDDLHSRESASISICVPRSISSLTHAEVDAKISTMFAGVKMDIAAAKSIVKPIIT